MYTELEGRVEEPAETRRRLPLPDVLAPLSEILLFGWLHGAITIFTTIIVAFGVVWRASVEEWVRAFDKPTIDKGVQGHLVWGVGKHC